MKTTTYSFLKTPTLRFPVFVRNEVHNEYGLFKPNRTRE